MMQFGVELGGGNSLSRIQPLHVELNKIFDEESSGNYFRDLSAFAIYFRVDGKLQTFGEEGPDNLEYLKKDKILGVDFVIPESIWKGCNDSELRKYFSNAVKSCFEMLLVKSEEDGFLLDKDKLVVDFKSKLKEFSTKVRDTDNLIT